MKGCATAIASTEIMVAIAPPTEFSSCFYSLQYSLGLSCLAIKNNHALKDTSKNSDLRASATRIACLPRFISTAVLCKKFLLTYKAYAAHRNFFHALLTIPHEPLLLVADRRPLVGHLSELRIFRDALNNNHTENNSTGRMFL